MVQQGLDKPFTGGLGSYKLYVLVAHHVSDFKPLYYSKNSILIMTNHCSSSLQIEHHLANGGNDRPSEILIR